MAKAESIEALLSPSLRVSRPVAACARCRSAKIKCDGKLPACSACERSGKAESCSASNDEFARGKERSYVAALESASERLQRRIDELRANGTPATNASWKPMSPVRTISGSRRRDASIVDELVGDLGFLSVNATARDFHGFTSTMSFARLLLSASMAADLPRYGSSPLPPRYATTPLIQHYLDNIFVLMPFFSETDLMTSLSMVYQEAGKPASALDHWNVRMVLAISAGASSQQRGDANHEMALRHIAAALEFVDEVLTPGSISGVQAILLLVQYSMIDPEHFRSWYLIGMASRLMVDLGIHVEPSPDVKILKHTLEIRRRVFYCVFALDRAISMSLERAFAFTDDSAPEVQLPLDVDKQAAPQLFLRSIRPASFLFDIRRVQSVFYQSTRGADRKEWTTVYATDYIASVMNDIQSWQSSIPANLSQRQTLYFRLESLYTQIMVLSPSIKLPLAKISDANKTLLFELTFQFVDQIQPVIQDTTWHAFFTYTDICRVNIVAKHFGDLLWSDFDQLLCGGMSLSHQAQNIGLASSSPLENCTRTISCMKKIAEILDFAHQRWGVSTLRQKFEQEGAVLLGKLKSRQQELSSVQNITTNPNFVQQTNPGMSQRNSSTFQQTSPGIGHENMSFIPQTSPGMGQANMSTQDNYAFGIPQLLNPMPSVQETTYDSGQRPQFFSSTPSGPTDENQLPLPQGSLPRRSYEFMGGPSS